MLGTFFDKVSGLFDKGFVIGLLLPVFAFAAGIGALVATTRGWTSTRHWWVSLDGSTQATFALAVAVGLVFVSTVFGTQTVLLTRWFEGYWPQPLDATLGRAGRAWQGRRRTKLDGLTSELAFQRRFVRYPDGEVQPTLLGNVLRAAESYPGDPERWQLDAVFWWPRLYLLLPADARTEIDSARASLDQSVVLSALLLGYVGVDIGFGIAGIRTAVWLPAAAGALVLSYLLYRTAVSSAAVYGELVRACYDVYRTTLLKQVGWPVPATLGDERRLWKALGQQLYRRGTSDDVAGVLDADRTPPPDDVATR